MSVAKVSPYQLEVPNESWFRQTQCPTVQTKRNSPNSRIMELRSLMAERIAAWKLDMSSEEMIFLFTNC